MNKKTPPSPKGIPMGALMGCVSMAIGAFLLMAGLGVIRLDPQSVHGPLWIMGAAGLMFFLAGLLILFQSIAGPGAEQLPLFQWVQYILVGGILVAFSAVFIWVGLGPGERQFESSASLGPANTAGQGVDLLGRCLFGGFGLTLGLVTLYYLITRPMQILGWKTEEPTDAPLPNGDNHEGHPHHP